MTTTLGPITAAALALCAVSTAAAQSVGPTQADWPSYYGTHSSWSYSALDQINTRNVGNLRVAWVHQPGTVDGGLQSTPLAIDGVVYYSSSYNRVFAVDGATGRKLWHYYPYGAQNEAYTVPAQLPWQPYNRGLAASHGRLYQAMLDGSVVALDMKTGAVVWRTQVFDIQSCGCPFTGAPLAVKDKVIVGQVAGELPIQGKILALDAATGRIAWEFRTIEPQSWGGDSWKYGGGGAWMTGSYDPAADVTYWGTGNPNPDFSPMSVRPGDNLYTSTVVALDPDDGRLIWHFQEMPHDDWDFDAAIGEKLLIDRDGRKYLVHYSKSGFMFIYDRERGTCERVYPVVRTFNFVRDIRCGDRKAELVDPVRTPLWGSALICPWNIGAHSWNAGSYSPRTGLYYQVVMEACNRIWVQDSPPQEGPPPAFRMGGTWQAVPPPDGPAHGTVVAFDPFGPLGPDGRVRNAWEIRFRIPPLGTILSTAGGIVALNDYEGILHVWDDQTGRELFSFRTGSGSRGGVITYLAGGKQYLLVTSGMAPQVLDGYGVLWPDTNDAPLGAAVFAFEIPGAPAPAGARRRP